MTRDIPRPTTETERFARRAQLMQDLYREISSIKWMLFWQTVSILLLLFLVIVK